MGREVFKLKEGSEPVLLQRMDRRLRRFLQRTIHLIVQLAIHLHVEHRGKGQENDRQRGSVPKRESDSQGETGAYGRWLMAHGLNGRAYGEEPIAYA